MESAFCVGELYLVALQEALEAGNMKIVLARCKTPHLAEFRSKAQEILDLERGLDIRRVQ
jgi:hypothetical protein